MEAKNSRSSSSPPLSRPQTTGMINSDTDLLVLLQVRLCRFCTGPSTSSRPFVIACACQGPNSATHAGCLEAYLEANPHNRARCDVCCRPYHFTTSRRSRLEWAVSSDAWDNVSGTGGGQLPHLLQLIARTLNILWALVMSAVIVLSTTTYTGSTLANSTTVMDGKQVIVSDKSHSSSLKIIFGLLIIAFSLLRLGWVLLVLVKVARATREQMNDWLTVNQKVTLVCTERTGRPSSVQDSKDKSTSFPAKELKLIGHSAIRAAGLKPKAKTVGVVSFHTPKSKHSATTLKSGSKKDV